MIKPYNRAFISTFFKIDKSFINLKKGKAYWLYLDHIASKFHFCDKNV